MKKVLFLIGSLKGGGAEKVLVDTVNALDSNEYQITVQTLFNDAGYQPKLAKHVRYKTIVTHKQSLLRKIAAKTLFYILNTQLVYEWYIRDDYDYEIAFLEGLPTKVISGSTNRNAKKIAWVHTDLNALPDSYRAYGSEQKEGTAYSRFHKVVCVSKAVEKEFRKKYPDVNTKIETINNVLDDAAIRKAAVEEVVLPTSLRPCFISVGSLSKAKGYDRLLRVHKRLMDQGFAHSLLILGEGDLRHSLEKYIKENQLEKSVFLLGFQTNPHKYVSKADLFVCSSYAEGFSTVISESVLCGTPVLATDVSGNREPEETPRCSVIVQNNEEALYEALLEILKDNNRLQIYRKELSTRQSFFQKERLIAAFQKAVFDE